MIWNKLYKYMTSNGILKNGCRNCPVRNVHNAFSRDSSSKGKYSKIGTHGIFMMIIPVGTFCLGSWQVSRRKWKLKLIEELDSLTKQPAIIFSESTIDELKDMEYRKVLLKGKFDHSKELYLGPRPLIVDGDFNQNAGGMLSSGQSGFNVVTPFTLSDSGITILVNRGWVSRKHINPSNRLEGQVQGEVLLTGVIRSNERRAPFMPKNQLQNQVFTYRDVLKMSELTGSSPFFVDAVETFTGGPIGSQTRVTLRNEHLSYLLTWYSLSAVTSYLWYRKFILRKSLL